MPVHKVTIIPRGRSLGSTMFIPKKDVLTQAMKRMLNQIAMGLGGRIAEELVLGTSRAAPRATSSRSPRSPATWSATGA
jgi:ATP-dependent Zn protease